MRAMASARSTGSSNGPMTKALQSIVTTKSRVMNKRSHQDFYSVDSGGSLRKGDQHTKEKSQRTWIRRLPEP